MFAALLLLAGLQADADPLAPARAGKIRCIAPNAQARTCATIVHYTLRDTGGFDAVVTGMIEPGIAIEYQASGAVEDGAVCSIVRPIDFSAGKLTRNGAPLSVAMEGQVRARMMLALQPLAGKHRCYRDKANGDADVLINGVLRPELAQHAIWVKPDEGYAAGM